MDCLGIESLFLFAILNLARTIHSHNDPDSTLDEHPLDFEHVHDGGYEF